MHLHKNEYQNVHNNPEIDLTEWIDFGDFPAFQPVNFLVQAYGSSTKELITLINRQLKFYCSNATLTLILKQKLISKEFKKKLLSDNALEYHFDPYLAMLELVTEHLRSRKEW